jgi:hydrogenase maturation protein HypF
LYVEGAAWQRLGHLQALALPGGDVAAREPWRMAASVLHALGRGDEVTQRFSGKVGNMAARTVQAMLAGDIHCPLTTGAGRWFDAAAGALGISVKQQFEAEAAIALENLAAAYLADHGEPVPAAQSVLDAHGVLDLRPVLADLFALADSGDPQAVARGAALFHLTLVDGLLAWIEQAIAQHPVSTIVLGGGCFMNRIMTTRLTAALTQRGLRVVLPESVSCGDAGLALGQAWVARQQLSLADRPSDSESFFNEVIPCV